MGIFDKMFGSGANVAQDARSQKRFEELKQRYQSVLRTVEQQQVQLQNLHVENNKLVIKGTAPSEQAKNKIWDEINLVNPNADDITADFTGGTGSDASRCGRWGNTQRSGRTKLHGEGWG